MRGVSAAGRVHHARRSIDVILLRNNREWIEFVDRAVGGFMTARVPRPLIAMAGRMSFADCGARHGTVGSRVPSDSGPGHSSDKGPSGAALSEGQATRWVSERHGLEQKLKKIHNRSF